MENMFGIIKIMLNMLVLFMQMRSLSCQKYHFNTCFNSKPFKYVDRISVRDCRAACMERSHCVAVNYNRVFKLCQLHDAISDTSTCVGFVVIKKTDFPADEINLCTVGCPSNIDCNKIPVIAYAETFGNMLDIGSVVKAQCLYSASVSYITCQSSGEWTERPTCPPPTGSCGWPSTLSNSVFSVSTTTVGSIAVYTCDPGYSASPTGSSLSVTCQASLQWETVTFSCEQVGCGPPPDITNTQRTFSTTLTGDVAVYSCSSGYDSSPSGLTMDSTCLDTGQWQTVSLTCVQINCGSPPSVWNSISLYSSTVAGSAANYTCLSGFTPSPSGSSLSILCLNTGQWETVSFTCTQVNCGAPPTMQNTQTSYTSTLSGSTVDYTCDSGYDSSPPGMSVSANCLDTGQWEVVTLTCELIDCGTPPDVANSISSFSSTLPGSSVTYTCNSGYYKAPSLSTLTLTCLSNGQWETVSFVCKPRDCGTPPSVSNSQMTFTSTLIDSIVTYGCNDGFQLMPQTSSPSIQCQHSGDWEPINFNCAVISNVTPGSTCNTDADCDVISAVCIDSGMSSLGKICYCKRLYEFSQADGICKQVCQSYTRLEKFPNQFIRKHNMADSQGFAYSEDGCLKYCEDNYAGQYSSVDHRHATFYGTNCFCGSVTRQQVLDGSPSYLFASSSYNMFSWTC